MNWRINLLWMGQPAMRLLVGQALPQNWKILASQGHTLHAHGIAQRFITYKQYSNAAHIATSIISVNIKREF